jgi:hypothetical protein
MFQGPEGPSSGDWPGRAFGITDIVASPRPNTRAVTRTRCSFLAGRMSRLLSIEKRRSCASTIQPVQPSWAFLVGVGIGLMGSIACASITGASGLISGSVTNSGLKGQHLLALLDAAQSGVCQEGQTLTTWNQIGPAGARGDARPRGPSRTTKSLRRRRRHRLAGSSRTSRATRRRRSDWNRRTCWTSRITRTERRRRSPWTRRTERRDELLQHIRWRHRQPSTAGDFKRVVLRRRLHHSCQ